MQNLLKWLICSPVLLEGGKFLGTDSFFHLFSQEGGGNIGDFDIARLELAVSKAPPNERHTLGGLFEWLIASLLRYGEGGTKLLAHSIQVREGNQTLGEMDFLIERGNRVLHLEAAVKFYLAMGDDISEPASFVGTNKQDTMGRKMTKLLDKQLRVTELPATAETLKSLDLPMPEESLAVVKGRLFYPFRLWASGVKAPWASVNHLRGWWLDKAELENLKPLSQQWVITENKQQWLVMPGQEAAIAALDWQQMIARLQAMDRPVMIHAVEQGAKGNSVISSSGFVVPSWWAGERG